MLKNFERDVIAGFCDSVGNSMHFQQRNVINKTRQLQSPVTVSNRHRWRPDFHTDRQTARLDDGQTVRSTDRPTKDRERPTDRLLDRWRTETIVSELFQIELLEFVWFTGFFASLTVILICWGHRATGLALACPFSLHSGSHWNMLQYPNPLPTGVTSYIIVVCSTIFHSLFENQ